MMKRRVVMDGKKEQLTELIDKLAESLKKIEELLLALQKVLQEKPQTKDGDGIPPGHGGGGISG
jgi:hypothetical protein